CQIQCDVCLTLVRSDHQNFCRRRPNKELSKPQHCSQGGLSVTPGHGYQRRSHMLSKRACNDLLLKITQLHRLPRTVTTWNDQVFLNEPDTPLSTILRPALKRERLNLHTPLRTSSRHNYPHQSNSNLN